MHQTSTPVLTMMAHTCLLQPSHGGKAHTPPLLDGANPLAWLHCSRQADGMPKMRQRCNVRCDCGSVLLLAVLLVRALALPTAVHRPG